ncbi:hypothetical protein [Streptomyces salinarius]|uniref:hypothetical protein n=1 Tax=Streptomyces salinarius TaxID=2762598 RepID=UPI0013DA8C44|nr:hypothetical protein [Streptomyces salinarius]
MTVFVLEFFGAILQVVGMVEQADLSFFFGPHLREEGVGLPSAPLVVHFAQRAGAGAAGKEVRVVDGDGRLLRRLAYHGMGGIPPVLPPFAAMNHRYAVVQAAVLARQDSVVALVGGIGSPRNSVALALGGRGWRMVSPQYLVVDRATGHTLPFQLPFELRGPALETARAAGLTDGSPDVRPARSPLTGDFVRVRPERLTDTVAVGQRLGPAALVRLCTAGGGPCRLEERDFAASVWPPDAAADPGFAAVPRLRLLLPEAGGAEEAADLLDERLTALAKGAAPCPAVPPTQKEHPAGSTTWGSTPPVPGTSTLLSSAGSSAARAAVATT